MRLIIREEIAFLSVNKFSWDYNKAQPYCTKQKVGHPYLKVYTKSFLKSRGRSSPGQAVFAIRENNRRLKLSRLLGRKFAEGHNDYFIAYLKFACSSPV